MTTTILAQSATATSLTDAVIAYLQAQGEPTPFTLVDAMAAELATLLEQGQNDVDDLEASDFQYALLKVNEAPIPFDLYPTCLWPNW
jgi:type II secretory pathway predicted ATPase ExeA